MPDRGSLRYQVNPHFLFNTLTLLSSLVIRGDKDKAEEIDPEFVDLLSN